MNTKANAYIEVCGEVRGITRQRAAFLLRQMRREDVYRRQNNGRGFAREYHSTGRTILVLS